MKYEGFGVLKTEKDFLILENMGKILGLLDFSLLRMNFSIFPWRSYETFITNHFNKKGRIHSLVQEISSSCRGWSKKSKLTMTLASIQAATSSLVKIRVVAIGSTAGDGLRGPDKSHNVVFNGAKGRSDDGLDDFDSDGDGDEEQKS